MSARDEAVRVRVREESQRAGESTEALHQRLRELAAKYGWDPGSLILAAHGWKPTL